MDTKKSILNAIDRFSPDYGKIHLRQDFPRTELSRAAENNRLSGARIASHIDHTLLKPDATSADVRCVCSEAVAHRFYSVCLNSRFLPIAREALSGSGVLPIAVVGFPLGAMAPKAKAWETRIAVDLGAREIDTVVAIGALKEGAYDEVRDDLRAVVEAAAGAPVKVILETSLLTLEEKIAACVIAEAAGAAFVKTSTGFGGGGATLDDVALMRAVVGPGMKVKASGGIRSRADALRMLAIGAERLGTSASVAIVGEGASAPAGGY